MHDTHSWVVVLSCAEVGCPITSHNSHRYEEELVRGRVFDGFPISCCHPTRPMKSPWESLSLSLSLSLCLHTRTLWCQRQQQQRLMIMIEGARRKTKSSHITIITDTAEGKEPRTRNPAQHHHCIPRRLCVRHLIFEIFN
jgi:hypothetical protein